MLRFELLWRAGLLVLEFVWCREIFGRWRDDVAKLKMPDGTQRAVIVGLWGATAVIMFLMGAFLWGVIANVIRAF